MSTHNRRLTEVLSRARLAVIGAQSSSNTAAPLVTVRPTEPPRPVIRPPNPAQLHPGPLRPSYAELGTVTDLEQLRPGPLRPSYAELGTVTDLEQLRPGPLRLLELLHRLAVDASVSRAYPVAPSQATLHLPQELIAKCLCVHVVTVWRWAQELLKAGHIAVRGHYTTSKGATRADGTLYAVSLKAGHIARLAHDDLSHSWRDLDADRAAGNTAWKALQWSETRDEKSWYLILARWAAVPGSINDDPLVPDHCTPPGTLQDAAHSLPLIATAHPTKRPALIGMIASTISHALHDQHSRRYWFSAVYAYWAAGLQGRAGLQVLAAHLMRLDADLREWPTLRKPAALLVSRIRPQSA